MKRKINEISKKTKEEKEKKKNMIVKKKIKHWKILI